MATPSDFLALIRERLAAVDAERAALLRLISIHEGGPEAAPVHGAPVHPVAPAKAPFKGPAKAPGSQGQVGTPFAPSPGGATERLIEVLKERPGLRYAELIEEAFRRGVNSTAKDPRKTLGNTISMLYARKVITRDNNKRYFMK